VPGWVLAGSDCSDSTWLVGDAAGRHRRARARERGPTTRPRRARRGRPSELQQLDRLEGEWRGPRHGLSSTRPCAAAAAEADAIRRWCEAAAHPAVVPRACRCAAQTRPLLHGTMVNIVHDMHGPDMAYACACEVSLRGCKSSSAGLGVSRSRYRERILAVPVAGRVVLRSSGPFFRLCVLSPVAPETALEGPHREARHL
jgi:hypothetical protein